MKFGRRVRTARQSEGPKSSPAKPFNATASMAPPLETLQSVCRNKTTQPPRLSGINPRGAAANESTRHLGYDDLLAASRPSAINVVDAGWSPRASAQHRITVGGPDGAKANNLTTTSSDSAPSIKNGGGGSPPVVREAQWINGTATTRACARTTAMLGDASSTTGQEQGPPLLAFRGLSW